jgi:hypothetical protein
MTGGGFDEDATYLRLDNANNPAAPNNYLRQSDGDARYLQLTGGTISGSLTVDSGATITGTLNAQGATLGSGAGDLQWPMFVAVPDTNDTRIWLGTRRWGAGSSHDTSQNLIVRKVDSTYVGGLSMTSTSTTLYYHFTTGGPYDNPNSYVDVRVGQIDFRAGYRDYTLRSDPTVEGNAPSIRNVLIGSGVPDNAWGEDGDIYIQHQTT